MVWRQRLLTAAVVALVLGQVLTAASPAVASSECSESDGWARTCDEGSLTGGGVRVSADRDTVGSPNSPDWVPPEGWFKCNGSWWPPKDAAFWKPMCRDEITVTGPPTPSMSDVREFYPASTTISSEPQGWALKGRPFNLVADTTPITRSGTVLGLPTQVTFTPTRWNWDYGDGTTQATDTGGISWATSGRKRFTTTPTSHTYTNRGDFTVSLSVDYKVTYQFGNNPWRPIDGILVIRAGSMPVRVVVGSTVLTTGPCTDASAATC